MKYAKTVGLTIVGAAVLMAFVGACTASATVLCKNNESASNCNENYPSETEITTSLVAGTKTKLKTEFKTVECSKSTISTKTENGGKQSEALRGSVSTLSFGECNCTVNVMKKGSFEIQWISPNDGTLKGSGTEVSVSCSTIFGTVHCIYATNNTGLGTFTGGNPAKIAVSAEVLRLTTSALCGEESTWEGNYEVTSPKSLYITEAAALEFDPDPLKFTEVNVGKILKIKNTGTATVNNIGLGIENEKDFEMTELCDNETLEEGETCEESIKCLTKGAKGKFAVFSGNPFVLIDGTLKC